MAKRLFDIVCVIPGLLVLTPLFLLLAVCIKLNSSGPVFFRQERVGQYGKLFRILKFRTMFDNPAGTGLQITVGNDQRITSVGSFLRKFKLDELPQLINVLKGEMSLVGPRPEVPEYVDEYPDDMRQIVLSVKPGITDLASIEYRNENALLANAEDPHKEYVEKILPIKLEYYRDYAINRNLLLDLILILKTFKHIIVG